MSEPSDLFRRQAEWQKSLRNLPWPEKIRMAARLRSAVIELRRMKPATSNHAEPLPSKAKQDPS
jgi:hypothetical protein